ncbi:hypothetical protein STAFG_0067 [Streptomyces afghaniensis 772]|uniref:Uncharacterized protein n=1 Tax=Streptomyces afghaniensis 772 TaxID=1283301 RepID=S4N4B8_9ACTN|nr:hypothetical protein STAFG_0067 [Streptomyces afghaniensis 772]
MTVRTVTPVSECAGRIAGPPAHDQNIRRHT